MVVPFWNVEELFFLHVRRVSCMNLHCKVKSLPATQKVFRVHCSSSWVLCTSHPEVLHTRPHKRLYSFDLPATQPTHSPTIVRQDLHYCGVSPSEQLTASSSQHTNHACSFSGRFPWHCLLHLINTKWHQMQVSTYSSIKEELLWLLSHCLEEPDTHSSCDCLREAVTFYTTLQAHTKVAIYMKLQATPQWGHGVL